MNKLVHSFVNNRYLCNIVLIMILVIEIIHYFNLVIFLLTLTLMFHLLFKKQFYTIAFIIAFTIIYFSLIVQFQNEPSGQIYKVREVNDYNLIAEYKNNFVLVKVDDTSTFRKESEIKLEDDFDIIINQNRYSSFNTQRHYNSQKVYYETSYNGEGDTVYTKKQSTVINQSVKSYYKLIFKGETDENTKELKSNLVKLSIIHIFVISGFHIVMIANLFKRHIPTWLTCIIVYLLIRFLDLNVSAYRALIYYTFSNLLNVYKVNKINVLAITALSILLVNPFITLSVGYRLSVGITYGIILVSDINKHKYVKFILIQFFILPIIIFLQYEINIFFFLLPFIITPFYLFLVKMMLINMILPIDSLILLLFTEFSNVIAFLTDSIPFVIFGRPSMLWLVLYYFIWIKLVKSNYKLIFILIGLILYKYSVSSIFGYVSFIDVGQGDSILIKAPLSNQAVLIDTGGSIYYDVAVEKVIPYLKYENIKSIDTVLISHDDFDHSGALESLNLNYNVKSVVNPITNSFNNGAIYLHKLEASILEPKDLNDTSIFLLYEIYNSRYLFTGDASNLLEFELYKNHSDLYIDYLKVAHHGSNTSTSNNFLQQTSPQYAIISYGKNFYGHPHPAVIGRLITNESNILSTYQQGTIKIKHLYFYDLIFTNQKIIINNKK